MRIRINERVLAFAKVEDRTENTAEADARRLLDQYEAERRAWQFAKQSFVPLMMVAMAMVL